MPSNKKRKSLKKARIINIRYLLSVLVFIFGVAATMAAVSLVQKPKQASPVEARRIKMGTVTVLTSPPIHYHQTVELSFSLPQRPQQPNFIVSCNQNGKWVFAAEGVNRILDPRLLQGTVSIVMESESQTLLGGFDYTIPAQCYGYIADEGTRNGKPTAFATNSAGFTVYP